MGNTLEIIVGLESPGNGPPNHDLSSKVHRIIFKRSPFNKPKMTCAVTIIDLWDFVDIVKN